jgi:DNA invertase Pin-like site-specific DNA recombinase
MRAAIYCRVSTLDQNPQSQLLDLQQLAAQRAFEVVRFTPITVSVAPEPGGQLLMKCWRMRVVAALKSF